MTSEEIARIIALAFSKGFEMGVKVMQDPRFEALSMDEIKEEVNMQTESLVKTIFAQEKRAD